MIDETDQQTALTWRERLVRWWAAVRAWERWPSVVAAVLTVALGVAFMVAQDADRANTALRARATPDWAEQAQQLDARVAALEAAQLPAPAVQPTPATGRANAGKSRISTPATAPAQGLQAPDFPAPTPITRQSVQQYRAELRGQE